MPNPQPPRPGLDQFRRAGDDWQEAKLDDLTNTFGTHTVKGDPHRTPKGRLKYEPIDLATDALVPGVGSGMFIVEAQYEIGPSFEKALGIESYRTIYNLDYAALRPDIIQVLPPGHSHESVTPSGEVLPVDDQRLQLRIIDIKLSSEPSVSYLAEIAYYTMALAGWLIDKRLNEHYVVIPNGAIWPGSYEDSKLLLKYHEITSHGGTPTYDELFKALQEDLEPVPFEVLAFRLRRFLQHDLPKVLNPSVSWQDLEWHVDNRCKGCENLGYDWGTPLSTPHRDHCIPTAIEQSHLSRVAFMSRGARRALESQLVKTVTALAACSPSDPAFDVHHVLKATRTVISSRADSLETGISRIAPESGSSAMMPKWADLKIYLSADYDIGSAITVAFGVRAFWKESLPINPEGIIAEGPTRNKKWKGAVFTVEGRQVSLEQREFLNFLDYIHTILKEVDESTKRGVSVQFYIWDSLQFDHLARVMGRHLHAVLTNATLSYLAWLFPPEGVLADPDSVIRKSPLTIVRDVVRSVLSAAIPHYYSLLNIARIYQPEGLPPSESRFSIHPLFEDPLSDQIPSERAHEIWFRSGNPHWSAQLGILCETVKKRLVALDAVVSRLREDLKNTLKQSAPNINLELPARQNRVSADGQLWYAFAKLNAALEQMEVQQIWAMPPHEREARFNSAHLVKRLLGTEEADALTRFSLTGKAGRYVYQMSNESREVKFREHDFNCAVSPKHCPDFLSRSLKYITRDTPLEPLSPWHVTMDEVMGVTIAGIDRERCQIVLDVNRKWADTVSALEEQGLIEWGDDLMLDPTATDFFTKKLLAALQAIGNPTAARAPNALVLRATGRMRGRGARVTMHTPPADLLWGAHAMHETRVSRTLGPVRTALVACGINLNNTQWSAWEEALTRRLHLIWGPPGTGKSRTARAIVLGAAVEAYQQNRPIRILICTSTYKAMDNVLLEVDEGIRKLLPATADLKVQRLRSKYQPVPDFEPTILGRLDAELNKEKPSSQITELRVRLKEGVGITVIGSTPEQVHNLLVMSHDAAQQEFFDLILIDEASQMDVAHSILPLCSLASGGSVILTGDILQLPPIHKAEAPVDLEGMVGSIYTFCKDKTLHGVPDQMLDVNYRSNSTLVEFSHAAGYEGDLKSHSPDLRMHLLKPVPTSRPSNWPPSLYWTPEWAELLNPNRPAVSFVYSEGLSSQWNKFEADAVASLIVLLYGRLSNQLLNEADAITGTNKPESETPYTAAQFWDKAVGVVTPHRAQQGLIISRLQSIFSQSGQTTPKMIRDAVDTVERFQGQQRDVVIASFSLGDPDAISTEDEFLMSLHRFNVMASRARAKLIVFVTQEVIDHLSDDLKTLRASRLIKYYTESFCRNKREMKLGWQSGDEATITGGLFKYR
jgi:hypothetical protein